MPEIDIDLFQVLTLAGLAILLILVLALTSAVAKLAKTVKSLTPGASESESAAAAATEDRPDASFESAAGAAAGTVAATGAVSSSEETIAAELEPQPEEAATSGWTEPAVSDTSSGWTDPAAETPAAWAESPSDVEAVDAAAAESEVVAEPVAEAEPEPVTAAATEPVATQPASTAQPAGTEHLPEEQPFERGGRWWFKRGDELLVYEEATGQWTAAPEGAFASASSAGAQFQPAVAQTTDVATTTTTSEPEESDTATETWTASETAPEETAAQEQTTGSLGAISDETATAWRSEETVSGGTEGAGDETETSTSMWGIGDITSEESPATTETPSAEPEAPGTFWKCPSCGAVNGSTATTCRMCFAQRPSA